MSVRLISLRLIESDNMKKEIPTKELLGIINGNIQDVEEFSQKTFEGKEINFQKLY